ncbi:hypothetical protein GCM10023195_58570 [Actinoallomurus liliacearum]|uniref:Threonyl-tRNA synthetase editing domain-containing protein n=1 Tax=Actinoallomurus liliacearum TaxID=1080073 RepID=A0ABP8TTV8_9ACTN
MKILCLECRAVEYVLQYPTQSIVEPDDAALSSLAWDNCLLLLITIEPGDLEKIRHAAKAIRRVCAKTDVKSIVINGFAHLSHTLASPEDSHQTIVALRDRLVETTPHQVEVTPFGWQKSFTIDVMGNSGSQRFIHV